jgi:hypothetical protein
MDRMIFRQSYGTERMRMIIPYGHTHTLFENPTYKCCAQSSVHSQQQSGRMLAINCDRMLVRCPASIQTKHAVQETL